MWKFLFKYQKEQGLNAQILEGQRVGFTSAPMSGLPNFSLL